MSDGLKELQELTKKLPSIDYVLNKNASIVEYPTIVGTCFGFPLFRNDKVSIQRAFLSKGTIYPEHTHTGSTEYYILYKGLIAYRDHTTDKIKHLRPGDSIKVDVNQNHSLHALEDSEIVVVRVPPDSAYPDF